MANVYVTQSGSGVADGTTIADSIAIGSLLASHWNTPTHSNDGTERIYFYGTITTKVGVLGAGGTSDALRLWIDLTNATISDSSNTLCLITNTLSFLTVDGGIINSSASNTTSCIDIFRSTYITVQNMTINSSHGIAIRLWCSGTAGADDADGIIIDGCTITQTAAIDCIKLAMSDNGSDTAIYRNFTFKNNKVVGGKLINAWQDIADQIDTLGRRPVGLDIYNNSFSDTPGNAIQIGATGTSPISRIRNNTLTNIGTTANNTNAIQSGNNLGLIIENNHIVGVPNGTGATGDGCCIIVDWLGSGTGTGRYSEDVIVRGNYCSGANSAPKSAGISIWAGTRTKVYGNIVVSCNSGISSSEAISGGAYPIISTSVAAATVITYDPADGDDKVIYTGDTVTISGVTGGTYSPSINDTFTATYISNTTFTVPVDCSVAGSGGNITEVHRSVDNEIYNNTLIDNINYSGLSKYGAAGVIWRNNIFKGSPYGLWVDDSFGGGLGTETNNCFYDNTANYELEGVTQTIDATSSTSDPLLDSNYIPDPYGPCYHAGITVGFNMKDFKGYKFNNPPTIGAYEFTSGSVALDRIQA